MGNLMLETIVEDKVKMWNDPKLIHKLYKLVPFKHKLVKPRLAFYYISKVIQAPIIRELKELNAIRSGDSDLYKAMIQIAKTDRGPENQVPSIGCSIKWLNS